MHKKKSSQPSGGSRLARGRAPSVLTLGLVIVTLALSLACAALSQGARQAGSQSLQPGLPKRAQPTSTKGSPGSSLRELAAGRGMWMGASVSSGWLQDADYASLVVKNFNLLTPENELKFEVVHPEQKRYDFASADALVEFALQHAMRVRGHTLVWDSQLPEWVRQASYSREEWKAILREHIHTVVGRYSGQIYAWDVVNEPFEDSGELRDTLWLRAIGPEYIALAFQWAHEADPQALLFLNEHGAEGMNAKSQAVYALVQGLQALDVPLDGVGFQMHVWIGGPPSADELAENMQRLAELGLQVQITEMDVRLQYSEKSQSEKLSAQAETYRQVLEACLQAPNCDTLVTWGVSDRQSWIPGFTGQADAPLLLDEYYRPKPAYQALVEALSR